MPSTAPADKLTSNLRVRSFDHDPGATTAVLLTAGESSAYQDMRDADCLLVVACASIVAGDGITLLEIVADDNTAFSSPTVIKAHAASATDAVGNFIVLEISDQDLQAVGEDGLRYATARLTNADATDEAIVTLIAGLKRLEIAGSALALGNQPIERDGVIAYPAHHFGLHFETVLETVAGELPGLLRILHDA